MHIRKIQHSPFPVLRSVITTRLIFNKTELKALSKAKKILADAEEFVFEHLASKEEKANSTVTLSDIDYDLSSRFHGQYHIADLLEDHYPDGLKIDD